ncbi:pilus assembly protein FimV [Thalassolituus maritimus]|uniref:Pilus assembly protein FimV n=1 Tax=Thalassolituus maritimus TaxID=484498 RepID=A0A1N7L3B1_9GAMM|nr:FimV/HubP family polar landmark protein [Thalassolituus maritimus]SIS68342.1 pilus assembly protein FimV [Thalassolituus maritimus]
MKRLLAKSILLAGGMSLSSHILALGLGEMELDSALNQPLSAEIKLIDTQGLTSSEIKPKLASAADFERAGIDRYQFLTQMKFSVNGDRILITTRDPVNEPFLNFLVELNWPAGRVLREYTVLLDPPVFEEGRVQPLVAVPAGSVQSQTTVTAPQSRPEPKPTPKRSNSWQTPAAPGTYKVQPNDTLWEIALATRPDASVTPQQMMIALQDVNPGAFINGNINRLKTHTVLDIPDASIIETVNNREAVAEVVRQNRELKAGVAQIDATGRNTDTSGPRKSTGNGEVRLLASEASGDSNQSGGAVSGKAGTAGAAETDLAIALENLDKSQRENQELVERLNALEEQLAKMERLISLQNDQLANMQAGTEPAAKADATVQEPAAETAGVATTEAATEQTSESVTESATTPAEDAAPVEQQTETEAVAEAAPQEAPATEDAESESEAGTDYNYSEGAAAETEQAAPVQTAEQKAMAERAAAEARRSAAESDKGIVAKVMADPYPYFAVAAGLLLMLVYAIMKLKARKEEDAVAEAEAELNAAEAAAMAPGNSELDLPDNNDLPGFDDNLSSDHGDDSFGNFDLGDEELGSNIESDLSDIDLDAYEDADGEYETVGQTEDAISESDIYIAYGKFDQAIELLKGAIASEPERTDLRLKQLEVLSSLDDAEAFAEAEANLIAIGDSAANAEAAEFRQQLSNPIEPEIRADEPGALSLDGELPSIDESAEDEFEGGMDFGAALDFGDDAAPEDDGIGAQLEEVPDLKLDESSDFDAEKEGVDMSLEDDAPELDDDLLNFDLGDDDELSAETVAADSSDDVLTEESDSLASLDDSDDELPSLDLDADDLTTDFEDITAELPAESENDTESAIDFSVDDFDLDSESDDLVDPTETLEGPAESPVAGELADVEDDLSLDFEVDEATTSSNEELDDLLDADGDLNSVGSSEEELPELTFDVEDSSDSELAESADDVSVEEAGEEAGEEVAHEAPESDTSVDESSADEDELVAAPDSEGENVSDDLEALMSGDDDLAGGSDLIGGIDLDELAAADDEFDFLAGTDECATKLDLARAYVDMEDIDGAKELLQEVVQEGNDAQKQEAKDLMDKLA